MAAQKITPGQVYVVTTSPMDTFAGKIVGIYGSKDLAVAAATDGRMLETFQVQFPEGEEKADGKAKAKTPKKTGDASTQTEPKSNKKKQIPQGRANSLDNLTLLFTGTFKSMDRATCEATAEKFGAQVGKKIADVDYVVLGTKPGAKKTEEINNTGVKTMTEREFLDMIDAEFDELPPAKRVKT